MEGGQGRRGDTRLISVLQQTARAHGREASLAQRAALLAAALSLCEMSERQLSRDLVAACESTELIKARLSPGSCGQRLAECSMAWRRMQDALAPLLRPRSASMRVGVVADVRHRRGRAAGGECCGHGIVLLRRKRWGWWAHLIPPEMCMESL